MANSNIKNFESESRNKMVGVKLTQSEFDKLTEVCGELMVTKSRFFRFLYTEYMKKK